MSELKRRLEIMWQHTGLAPRWRYVPKAHGRNGAWRVWDRATQKFLSNKELLAIPIDALANEEFVT